MLFFRDRHGKGNDSDVMQLYLIYIYIYIYNYIYVVSCPVLTVPPHGMGGGRDSDTVYTPYIHSM